MLPTITSASNRWYVLTRDNNIWYIVNGTYSSGEGINKNKEREEVHTPPLPAIHQQPSHNVGYPIPVTAGHGSNMSASVPVLPVLLPWQCAQIPQGSLFDAHHNTTGSLHSKKVTRKEPWFKKFKDRCSAMCTYINCWYYALMLDKCRRIEQL